MIVTEAPAQMAAAGPAVIMGNGLTETVIVPVLLQPAALVPLIVYVVVTVGLAVVVVHAVHDSPVAGVQVYDVPPVAVSDADCPAHTATFGPAPIVGSGFTVTVAISVLMHPLASRPVTV